MPQLRVITGLEAERRLRCHLDKRKRYAMYARRVHVLIRWTEDCSGCSEYSEGCRVSGPCGCEECGYTGRRRRAEWVPVTEYPTRNRREFRGH